jgi:hypothetical protein
MLVMARREAMRQVVIWSGMLLAAGILKKPWRYPRQAFRPAPSPLADGFRGQTDASGRSRPEQTVLAGHGWQWWGGQRS